MKINFPAVKRAYGLPGNSTLSKQPKKGTRIGRKLLTTFVVVITASLSACSAATTTPAPAATSPAASAPQNLATATTLATPQAQTVTQNTPPPTSVPTPLAQSTSQQSAVQTSIDPCQLVSSQEASTLTGSTYGSGVEGTSTNGLNTCTYGAQTSNIFQVEVVQAPDVKTAQAYKAQFLADIQANLSQLTDQGINVTEIPGFADGAVMATISVNSGGIDLSGIGMGFLKGTIYVGFSDLSIGGAVPSSAAMQSEATTVLGRLP
jgi:hypothetical protein